MLIERAPKREGEVKLSSKIFLSFFRHSPREKGKGSAPLTPEGRQMSINKASDLHPDGSDIKDIKQAVAFGSSHRRGHETAGFVMGGGLEEITGEEDTIEELKEKLNEGINIGSKLVIDKRLNFGFNFESKLGKAVFDNLRNENFLKFIIEQSDELAKESPEDKESACYSRLAANIAEIIMKYVNVEKKWDKLANDKDKDYSKTLERYFGSHAGVLESFLSKIITKTKGMDVLEKFLQIHPVGFDYTSGFNVEIISDENHDPNNPKIHIKYEKIDENSDEIIFLFEENIDKKLLEEIISEKI